MQKQSYNPLKPGYNIEQRVKQDNKYAEYGEYAKKMQAIGRTTEWHEGHQKYEVWRQNKQNDKAISTELSEANRELKILRNSRLKDLYVREMEQFERELNGMGLAISKDRA